MIEKRPFIITFIGDGCILGASFLVLSLFPKFSERFGIYFESLPNYLKIPGLSENIMRALIAIILLIISYGYLKLKKWGYWLMVSINLFSLAIWIISYQQNKAHFITRNPISIIIVLLFILPTIKYFSKNG
ncbi:hypothetical protein [Clostridium sp. JNZ J1-5]